MRALALAGVGVSVAVVSVGAAALIWVGVGRESAPAPQEEALSATPAELYRLSLDNPIALEARYGGRLLRVTGEVAEIGGSYAAPLLRIEGGGESLGVECALVADAAPAVALLSRGSAVAVSGRLAPSVGLVPRLAPCDLTF